jgi:polysaccharide deacetylase family protein (PEP-CTERM system associated)
MRTTNVMTVDVEDWFNNTVLQCSGVVIPPTPCVEKNTMALLELFAGHGVTATWFFLGEVAESFPRLPKEVAAQGHEVGVHGYHHHQVPALSPEKYRESITKAKKLIEDLTGVEVRGYRAVDFTIDQRTWYALDILLDAGFKYDSSIFAMKGPRYGIANGPLAPVWLRSPSGRLIYEVPVGLGQVWRIRLPACGGGYFRNFPFAYTRLLLRIINRAGRKAVFYFHPCELERLTQSPNLPDGMTADQRAEFAKCLRREMRNRERSVDKLEKLFRASGFQSISEAFDLDSLLPPTASDQVWSPATGHSASH